MVELVGIAITPKLLAPMQERKTISIDTQTGLKGDARGRKRNRQVSILFKEDWDDACAALNTHLSWITRRANLFVAGMRSPQSPNQRIKINDVELVLVLETEPCDLMDKQCDGLQAALKPNWRGGVCCNVTKGGTVSIGDKVILLDN